MPNTTKPLNTLTNNDVIQTLNKEYPELREYSLIVHKQFVSITGRTYNTFLVEALDSPYGVFVAKSYCFDNQNLEDEVHVMNFLRNTDIFIPKILFQYKTGNMFLVIDFIDGTNAAELMHNQSDVNNVYRSIGNSLRRLYSVHVPYFHRFWENDRTVWNEHIQNKFEERLTRKIDPKYVDHIRKIYQKGLPAINEDAKAGPVLIHRDIYSDNFIIEKNTGKAILIDFAMARGGRPFYDLAKFYISNLVKHPHCQDTFLKHLGVIDRSESAYTMLRAYIVIELLGMINFYDSIGEKEQLDHTRQCLRELATERGDFHDLVVHFRI